MTPLKETDSAEPARSDKHATLNRAAGILDDLAHELEGAASRANAERVMTVRDNIADLRDRAGHLRYLAATVFPSAHE